MHSQLETYLSEVGAQLTALPVKKRNEELREMRVHLENAVIVSRELGQSEEEATQSIVEQFGPAQDLSENVVWAWRRGVRRDWRSLGSAIAYTFLLLLLGHFLMLHFGTAHLGFFSVNDLFRDNCSTIAAIICGGFFPRRAALGVGIGIALFYVLFHVLLHLFYAHAIVDAVMGPLTAWIWIRAMAWTTRKWPARRRLARH